MAKERIAVILVVVGVVSYLISLSIKGLISTNGQGGKSARATELASGISNIDLAYVSSLAKKQLASSTDASAIELLENRLKNATTTSEKINLQKQLAAKWVQLNQVIPSIFYLQAIAQHNNNYEEWINVGNQFNSVCKATQNTEMRLALASHAAMSFKNALRLQPESLDAKTGLGTSYVYGGASSPMQGITILLEVVAKSPSNFKANKNLGLFSLQSGQFDKAIKRFKVAIAQKPDAESYFYLAESYKQLGMQKEANAAYDQCKKLLHQ